MSVVAHLINSDVLTILHDTGETFSGQPVVTAQLSEGEKFSLFFPAGTPADKFDEVLCSWGIDLQRTIWL